MLRCSLQTSMECEKVSMCSLNTLMHRVSTHRGSGVSIFHASREKNRWKLHCIDAWKLETPLHHCRKLQCIVLRHILLWLPTGHTFKCDNTSLWSVESMDRCIYTFVAFHTHCFSYFHIPHFPLHYKDRMCDADSRNWVVRGS